MKAIFTLLFALFIQANVFSQVSSLASQVNNNRIDLKWSAVPEKNVSHFSIERSTDGKNFHEVGIVFTFENPKEAMNYPFFERNVKASTDGFVYYRLCTVTNNNIINYSEVLLVKTS